MLIDIDDDAAIRDVVTHLAQLAPSAVALQELDGDVWTFEYLRTRMHEIAVELPSGANRVAVNVCNDNESVARICAVWATGAAAVIISALLPDSEAARRVAETYCDAVLGRPGISAPIDPGAAPAEPDEALVIFTSGTTGRPKGTVLTTAAVQRSLAGIAIGSGLSPAGRVPTDPPRKAVPVFTPMAHMAGILGVLSGWHAGKPPLLVPKFDVRVALRLIDEFGITVLKLTPAMAYDLAHWPEPRGLGSVRSVTVGTAPIPDTTREAFEKRYGIPLLRNYGQTEFSGAIAFERYDDAVAGRRPAGTVGRIAPGVEVRIVGTDGADIPTGEPGEIVARGGGSMRGYLGPDGRPVSPGPQGWVHTGDVGALDNDGFLFVLGRVREMILCGGFNVYPAVVETALNAIPGVFDSAVAGMPDPRLGEVPVAVVVADGAAPGADEIRAALRQQLAPYEIPRKIVAVQQLPRTENGKPDRPGVIRAVEAAG